MSKQYMDYGNIVDYDQYTIPKINQQIDYERKGDVYRLTHDGEGKSLSFMNKAFISFTYGDKKIEDFGFIATTINNRLDRENSPDSEDYVTEYKMLHGQYYWGSHYLAREMTITLATDGVTQKQLDDFKYWFQAGEIKELILSQHPNRAIMARVQGRPEINVLPFKRLDRVYVNDDWQDVEIIEYKGEAQINFVMDEPFWYAKRNVLGQIINHSGHSVFADSWVDANGDVLTALDNDGYKIMVEDKIPIGSMINTAVNFSNGIRLTQFNDKKYTLYDNFNFKEQPPRLRTETGTPLINEAQIINGHEIEISPYPLSGAMIGPIYDKVYNQNEKINLNNYFIQESIEILQDTGNIIKSDNELLNDYFIGSILNYLPIKEYSTIQLNNVTNNSMIIIAEYTFEQKTYKFLKTIVLNNENNKYIADEQVYIRLTFIIDKQLLNNNKTYIDYISYNLISFNNNNNSGNINTEINNQNSLNYFYSGTAPSFPRINFSIPITFNEEGYIDSFSNSYIPNNNKTYDSLKLISNVQHELKLTNPGIFNAYNQVITKIKNSLNVDYVSLIQQIRNEIGHPIVRSWIINCINIYFNNYNNNQSNIEEKNQIDEVAQKQLLLYMPYLFASLDEAQIQIKQDEPNRITINREAIDILSVSRLTNIQLGINENNKIPVMDGQNLQLSVIGGKENWNYQWEYSNDNKKSWLGIRYESKDKWQGTDSQVLTMKAIDINNDLVPSLFIRCLVSNKTSHNYTQQYEIIAFDNTVSIINTIENLQIIQNEAVELNWNITGEYLTGRETFEGATNFKPRVYYFGSNGDWERCDINNTNTQLENITTDFNNGIYTFRFIARQNENHDLRNIQFKLRVYKKTAENSDPSNNDINKTYVESSPIGIVMTRFEKILSNDPLKYITISRSYNNESLTQYSNLNWPLDNTLAQIKGTEITIEITNVKNMDPSNSYFVYTTYNLELQQIQQHIITSLTDFVSNVSITSTSAQLKFLINADIPENAWFNSNNTIKFIGYGTGETIIFPQNTSLTIYQRTADDVNAEIINYSPEIMTYKVLSKNQYYTDETTQIQLVINTNQKYPATNRKIIQYIWQHQIINSNGEQIWQEVQNQIYDTQSQNGSDYLLNFNSNSYIIPRSNNIYNISNSGNYRCRVNLKLYYPQATNQNLPYKTFENIGPVTSLNISIIERVLLTINSGQINEWQYYNLEKQIDDDLTTKLQFPYTHIISYNLMQGESSIANNPPIKLFKKINNTWRQQNDWNYIISNQQIQFSATFNTADDFWNYFKNSQQFCCQFKDIYGYTYGPSATNNLYKIPIFNTSVNYNSSREVEIISQLTFPTNSTKSWDWPVKQWTYAKTWVRQISTPKDTINIYQITSSSKLTTQVQTFQMNKSLNTNNQPIFTFSGIFPKKQFNSTSDNYDSFLDNNSTTNEQNDLKSTYNDNDDIDKYITILTIPSNIYTLYREMNFSFNMSAINENQQRFLKIKHGNTLIQQIQLTQTSFTQELSILSTYTENITLELGIFYNSTWSGIGYKIVGEKPLVGQNDIDSSDTILNTNKYDSTKFPSIPNVQITLTSVIAYPTLANNEDRNTQSNLQYRGVKLFSKLRSLPIQNNYIPPTINQLCPISINCQTGEYNMQICYNNILWPDCALTPEEQNGDIFNPKLICYLSSLRKGVFNVLNQSVGDMILYNDIVFTGQNHFNKYNKIEPWSEEDPMACYKITYDGQHSLKQFNIQYKNYYL